MALVDGAITMQAFYLARQPICDNTLHLEAYELLFRDDASVSANVMDGDRATSELIISSIVDIGLDRLVGEATAFINVTPRFLFGDLPLPAIKDQVVLEVLEDIAIDDALVERLAELSDAGYRLALDDFVFRPGAEALLPYVHFVKLDILALDPDQLADHVRRLRAYDVRLVAEKVESYEMLARCEALGFDLYQGFFFCKPKLIRGSRPKTNRLTMLQLLARIQDPEVGLDELERMVSADTAISYRLLRYINSAFCAVRVEVTSIRQALILVGTRQIREWATLLLMSHLGDSKPSELLMTALIRGRLCELLGRHHGGLDRSQCFTVGLLSVLDAMLDQPMEEVVEQLPLNRATRAALCGEPGVLGDLLRQVIGYERGRFCDGTPAEGVAREYLDAVIWANEMHRGFAG